MQPLAIVKDLDKLKGLAPGFVPCLERAVMHQLVLQRAEEALRDGVIVAVPPATHTGHQPMLGEDLPIGRRRILAALIRVVNQARLRPAVERPPQLDRPVHAARLVMQAYNLGGQQAIRHGPGTRWAGQPTIEATATHSQDPTHSGDPKLPLVIPNEGVLHGSSLAKYAAAFFKMSRSSLSRAFSRRSRSEERRVGKECRSRWWT